MEQLNLTLSEAILPLLLPDEIYDKADYNLLTALKEDRRIERKPAKTHSPVLGEYFSMWANTAPDGGLIALGMENNGSFSGCSRLSHNELNEREKAAFTYCPDASCQSKRMLVRNIGGQEDFVLLFRVYYREDKVVRNVAGDGYIRIADSKHKLTNDELRELEIDKRQVDLEKEPVNLKFPEDFNIKLISEFVQGVVKKRTPTLDHTNEELLEQRRLGKIENGEFIPNVACALLFARDPRSIFPGCTIRFLRYEGETEKTGQEYNVIKDLWLEGSVPELIVSTGEIVQGQLREFSRLDEDGKFYTALEYPYEAWYEAIVNACAHRSYGLKNIPIFVKMFDDRLVIESPGAFPPFVTPQNIYTSHHPRNPYLMDALYYLDFVKCHNEGTRRMRDAMQGMKLPFPEFEQKTITDGSRSVRVTLKNNRKQRKVWIDSDIARFLPINVIESLSQDERRILNFVGENHRINVSNAQRLLPHIKTWHTVKNVLTRLTAREILSHQHRKDIERDPDAHFILHPKWQVKSQDRKKSN